MVHFRPAKVAHFDPARVVHFKPARVVYYVRRLQPIANAYELLQGLRDVGVDTKLITYKGLGHVIYKPKERLAAIWHNWQWFGKYVFGEDIKMSLD